MCGVEEAQVEDVVPCTPLQEGLVAMSYQRPGDYLAQIAIELTNATDADLLIRAWQNAVCQMPILRTCIVDLGYDGLVQVILHPDPRLPYYRTCQSKVLLGKSHPSLGRFWDLN